MKVYHIINSIKFRSISILSMLFNARVAIKNVPNCFTSNSFADEIDESFVATLSPTLMIQWEDMFLQSGIPWLLNLCEYFKSVKIASKQCQSGLTINSSRGLKVLLKWQSQSPLAKQPIQVFFYILLPRCLGFLQSCWWENSELEILTKQFAARNSQAPKLKPGERAGLPETGIKVGCFLHQGAKSDWWIMNRIGWLVDLVMMFHGWWLTRPTTRKEHH